MTSRAVSPHVFVDSSAFYALVGRRDPHQLRALTTDRDIRRARTPLVTTNYMAAETHALVLGQENRALALQVLQTIDGRMASMLRITEEDEIAARNIVKRYTDKDSSLTDATSFIVMENLGIRTAFRFDRNFAEYGLTVP